VVASVTAVSAGHAGVGYLTGGGGCETDHEWDMAADGKHPDRERSSVEYYAGDAVGIWLG